MGGNRLILILPLLAPSLAVGQTNTGGLSGTVTDQSGGVIQGVQVTVDNDQTGARRVVHSDDGGRYRALQLAPGPYRVTVRTEGFETGRWTRSPARCRP
jgi:hypothetical protein